MKSTKTEGLTVRNSFTTGNPQIQKSRSCGPLPLHGQHLQSQCPVPRAATITNTPAVGATGRRPQSWQLHVSGSMALFVVLRKQH